MAPSSSKWLVYPHAVVHRWLYQLLVKASVVMGGGGGGGGGVQYGIRSLGQYGAVL
jgi:hypothetical protein